MPRYCNCIYVVSHKTCRDCCHQEALETRTLFSYLQKPSTFVKYVIKFVQEYVLNNKVHQQNQANLDSLNRAGQRTIEPQKLQKGAVLYSAIQLPAISVQLCGSLSGPVAVSTQ